MSTVFVQPGSAAPEDRARPGDRIFFCVLPDAGAKAEMARSVGRICGDRVLANSFDAASLHVSLCFLATGADLSPQIEQRARAAASTVRIRPFTAAFNCVARFSKGDGKRPLVLLGDEGVAGLMALQRSLGVAMRGAGFGRREQPGFTPHVTLLYGTFPIEEQTIEPIRWTVREFLLVHSQHRERRHSHLRRWPLRA